MKATHLFKDFASVPERVRLQSLKSLNTLVRVLCLPVIAKELNPMEDPRIRTESAESSDE